MHLHYPLDPRPLSMHLILPIPAPYLSPPESSLSLIPHVTGHWYSELGLPPLARLVPWWTAVPD